MVDKKKPTDYSNIVLAGGLGIGGYLLYKYLTGEEPPEPPPEPGDKKCIGPDLYEYIGGKWVIIEENSPVCVLPEEWLPADTELARQDFSVSIVESGWLPANTELTRQSFSIPIIESGWLPANTELARKSFSVVIMEPGLQSPEVKTLPAEYVTHNGAVLVGKLIDTRFWSNVDVYFEWGKTTNSCPSPLSYILCLGVVLP